MMAGSRGCSGMQLVLVQAAGPGTRHQVVAGIGQAVADNIQNAVGVAVMPWQHQCHVNILSVSPSIGGVAILVGSPPLPTGRNPGLKACTASAVTLGSHFAARAAHADARGNERRQTP